jgi:hypothetical protein
MPIRHRSQSNGSTLTRGSEIGFGDVGLRGQPDVEATKNTK